MPVASACGDTGDTDMGCKSRFQRVALAAALAIAGGVVEASSGQIVGDLDGDGVVDGGDFVLLMASWGPCPADAPCAADLDGDGVVDGADQTILLANWGMTAPPSPEGHKSEETFDSGGLLEGDPSVSGGALGGSEGGLEGGSEGGWDSAGLGGGDDWGHGEAVVHVVPLPAPILLTAIGLGLAAWVRRRLAGGAALAP
jgi:hypothetical protein